MHIVSWNVASWPTALNLITERHGSLDNFLARHRIDILALQEVKMQTPAIEKALIPRPGGNKSSTMPLNAAGYESFWAPARAQNTGSKSSSKGFNGVATFVRSGWTVRAERDPLQDAALDAEGRCVLTFHGSFAIFNCYIPFSGVSNERLPFKVKYLRALRRRMQAVRAEGYSVLLVGDLNIQRRLVDCHPDARRVDVRRVLNDADSTAGDGRGGEEDAEYCAAAAELREHWPAVVSLLRSRVAEPVTIRATHGPVDRWRLFATQPGSGDRVQLGSPFQSEAAAMGESGSAFRTDAAHVSDPVTEEQFESRAAETMRADELSECLSKVGLQWSSSRLAHVVERAGRPGGAAACREWLNALIEQDGMVDSFTELQPLARGRYTCWSQYLNERYSNCGSRIDYCLVDRAFFETHIVRERDRLVMRMH
jgi:exonuclease III